MCVVCVSVCGVGGWYSVNDLHLSFRLSETSLSRVASEVMSEYFAIVIWFSRCSN